MARKFLSLVLAFLMAAFAVFTVGAEDSSGVNVEKIDFQNPDFIRGMDVSSVISLEESGVTFKNSDGVTEDLLKILADNGVNYIRVRVWNNPYDKDGNGYGVVTLTIKDNAITECEYKTYEPDGTLKDENYGMQSGNVANKDFFRKAQKAVAACDEYASQLIQSGRVDDVDAISGATVNYNEFVEAANRALDKAKE